ncbi:MAG TPA: putative metal-dependent hydrolase [Bacilli bacterium]
MDAIRYPIGEFQPITTGTPEQIKEWIQEIEATPEHVRAALAGLTEAQLDTPYRPEGWTIRQVVHHIADANLHSFTRFKLALTEHEPTIKPYYEDRWGELADSKHAPIAPSLSLLEAVIARWSLIFAAMAPQDFAKTFIHPVGGVTRLDQALAMSAWHNRHHTAHITSLRDRMGW